MRGSTPLHIRRSLRDPWILFAIICLVISLGLIVIPQLSIFLSSLKGEDGSFSLSNYSTFFTSYRYQIAFVNSIKVTILTTLFATLIAVPLAWLLARFQFKGRNAVVTLITMATASPPFLGAYAWIILLGRYGVVNKIIKALTGVQPTWGFYGGNAVIWVITWMVFPLIFLMTFDSFSDEDVFHKEAAMSLGANPIKSFFHIELPLALPIKSYSLFRSLLSYHTTAAADGKRDALSPGLAIPRPLWYADSAKIKTRPGW